MSRGLAQHSLLAAVPPRAYPYPAAPAAGVVLILSTGALRMTNPAPSRRDFSKAAGAAALSAAAWARADGAGKRIRMAVIGCGGMGTGHVSSLVKRAKKDDVEVLAVCDVYQRRVTRA